MQIGNVCIGITLYFSNQVPKVAERQYKPTPIQIKQKQSFNLFLAKTLNSFVKDRDTLNLVFVQLF